MSKPNHCVNKKCWVNHHGTVDQPHDNVNCNQCGVPFGKQANEPPKKTKQGDK